jgi:hypothetical protein
MSTVRPEGHFWLGVNLALLAESGRSPSAVVQAWRARRVLLKASALDPAYHGAGPLRVLGRLEHKLPKILGGNFDRSRMHFEEALRIDPQNSVTRIYFAEMLIDLGELSFATYHLDLVLSSSFDPEWAFEIERDKRLAVKLKAEIESRLGQYGDG